MQPPKISESNVGSKKLPALAPRHLNQITTKSYGASNSNATGTNALRLAMSELENFLLWVLCPFGVFIVLTLVALYIYDEWD